jgi:capsular polysaccharide transport system permease protein
MNYLAALTPKRLKIALVAVPALLVVLYFGVIAPDRYVSESTVALRQAGADSSAVPGAALLLAGLAPPSREDTLYLRQYIGSLGLLQKLDAKLKVRQHYETQANDPIANLGSGSSQERFLDYFRSHLDVRLDELSSTLTIRTQGFDPKFAHLLNAAILEESERFVNETSHKLAREKLGFAEGELNRAAQQLQEAKAQVLAFQNTNRLLDPATQAQASGALVAQMQASIAKSEADLRQLRTFMNEDAYPVQALRSQIESTRAQLELERNRATGTGRQSDKLNALTLDFQALEMKAQFALDAYKLSLAAVENARIDATRKIKSLVVIEPPTQPETAEYPRRLYSILTVFVISLLLYGVVRLVAATIREHQD